MNSVGHCYCSRQKLHHSVTKRVRSFVQSSHCSSHRGSLPMSGRSCDSHQRSLIGRCRRSPVSPSKSAMLRLPAVQRAVLLDGRAHARRTRTGKRAVLLGRGRIIGAELQSRSRWPCKAQGDRPPRAPRETRPLKSPRTPAHRWFARGCGRTLWGLQDETSRTAPAQ